MREVGQDTCAGFLVGGAGACPLVGVVGPLVGRAVSKVVSRGSCGLRKSLGSYLLMGGAVSPPSQLLA